MGVARLWREAPPWRQFVAGAGVCTAIVLIGPPACAPGAVQQPLPQSPAVASGASGGSYNPVPSAASAAAQQPVGVNVPPPPATNVTPGITIVQSPSAPILPSGLDLAPNAELEGATIRERPRRSSEGFATIRPREAIADDGAIKPRQFQ